ncbi:hypothetical protein [Candidatus Laterigemmans baculatus]|uniref:hypothetical protein n=1 Tax=Candidatus Laterigemmans baculatus TaxID=2770505 RepID=UPI0013D902F1|nr:hypothetical protein [Candidatus Laterigemmans baculatus]
MQSLRPEPPTVDLMELITLFYPAPSELGDFQACLEPVTVPEPHRRLLDHEEHMTVTVEAFHGSPVDVRVARTHYSREAATSGNWYAREITLHRQSDGRPVQYGIVRLNIDLLDPIVWEEIEAQETPLGRVLIRHHVLREVALCGLWRVEAGEPLAELLEMPAGGVTFGRTARIFCDRLPAIELLEIVAPGSS